MSYRLNVCAALTVLLLAAPPCYAMSTITAPANDSTASRFTDPNANPQRGFSGAMTTIIIGGSSFGSGGSVTAGTNGLGGRIVRPEDRARSDLGPVFPDRRLPDSTPYGFNQSDPFAPPRDPYAPGLFGDRR